VVEMAAADQAISFLIGQMDKTATEVCSSSEGSPDSEQTELAFHTDLSAHLIRVEGELGRSCLQRVCTLRYGCRAQYGRVLVLLVQRWSRQWLRQVCDLAALIGCLARPAAYARMATAQSIRHLSRSVSFLHFSIRTWQFALTCA
jgi:hypothetical protein